ETTPSGSQAPATAARISSATTLSTAIAEEKIYKLLPGYNSSDDFEASGVYYESGYFYVVFDNRYKIAKIKSTLPINSSSNTLLSSGSGSSNFEGITYDNNGTPNFFVVEESVSRGSGVYQPRIREYDASMSYQNDKWCQYYFNSSNNNKAFEGIAWVYRGGEDYILGLVEGTGKIPVLKKTSSQWQLVDSITLPSSVTFTDYSDIAIYGNKVAITSQEDGQIWVGTLSSSSWSITGGTAYNMPYGSSSGVAGSGSYQIYGNIEGITFISSTQVAIVSDKYSSSQPSYQQYKTEMISIFNLP
ncbi:MAG: hypothetical protein EBZ77_13130, partial [Chitinophagia bacterium]|nr:hypothetical protein [Chitinophagia bacterium]